MKSVQIRSVSGPYFLVFGLNPESYFVSSLNTGKYGPEKTAILNTFYEVIHSANLGLFHLKSFTLRFGILDFFNVGNEWFGWASF